MVTLYLWQMNNRGLNRIDYEIWGIILQRVYRTKVQSVIYLRQRLMVV